MNIKDKIAAYIARGAEQLSRKHMTIAVPPKLGRDQTYFDLLRDKNPREWLRLHRLAAETLMRLDQSTHVTLTREEFSEWLVQHGCAPLADPPDGHETWADYWLAKRRAKGLESSR